MANQIRQIRITRSGGFAGISRTVVVDAAREADKVNHLATELEKLGPPGPGVPDGFTYQFIVDDETGGSREYVLPERELPPSVHPLVDDLIRRS